MFEKDKKTEQKTVNYDDRLKKFNNFVVSFLEVGDAFDASLSHKCEILRTFDYMHLNQCEIFV